MFEGWLYTCMRMGNENVVHTCTWAPLRIPVPLSNTRPTRVHAPLRSNDRDCCWAWRSCIFKLIYSSALFPRWIKLRRISSFWAYLHKVTFRLEMVRTECLSCISLASKGAAIWRGYKTRYGTWSRVSGTHTSMQIESHTRDSTQVSKAGKQLTLPISPLC